MVNPIKMPKLSDQMTEGKITEWLKKEGDEIKAGDVVAQVETEKATLDVEAFESGVLIGLAVKAGETAPVGQPIAWIGARGEKAPAAEAAPSQPDVAKEVRSGGEVSHSSTQAAPAAEAKVPVAPPPRPAPPAAREPPAEAHAEASAPQRGARTSPPQASARATPPPQGRVVASPAARKRARERGIELGGVDGSGPRGRVVLADVESEPAPREARAAPAARDGAAARPATPTQPPPAARRKRALPPRAELRDETLPLSPMRRAISRHPEVNAAWGADAIVRRGSVDVGVAVALDEGLVTPVVRGADRKDVFEIAAEIRDLAGRARERELRPEEYQGASFTISNLGMFGIEAFYAVINPPEAAILAVGAVQKVPWVEEATGALVAMERVRLGLSCDHRVVDGATGARFLQTLRLVLESPVRLVVT